MPKLSSSPSARRCTCDRCQPTCIFSEARSHPPPTSLSRFASQLTRALVFVLSVLTRLDLYRGCFSTRPLVPFAPQLGYDVPRNTPHGTRSRTPFTVHLGLFVDSLARLTCLAANTEISFTSEHTAARARGWRSITTPVRRPERVRRSLGSNSLVDASSSVKTAATLAVATVRLCNRAQRNPAPCAGIRRRVRRTPARQRVPGVGGSPTRAKIESLPHGSRGQRWHVAVVGVREGLQRDRRGGRRHRLWRHRRGRRRRR